jgi:hypothetical protein
MTLPIRFGLSLATLTLCSAFASGCAVEGDAEDDDAEAAQVGQALSSKAVCTKANIHSERCALIRFYLTEGAEGARRDAIQRAFSWVEQGVMYSNARNHSDQNGSYRRDCSGFVSMAWALPGSYSTRRLAPFNGEVSFELGAYSDLQPGDALNRPRPKNGNYHVVLFAGWADDAHTEWFALQELATGSPAMLSKHYWTELGEYRPIRKVGL